MTSYSKLPTATICLSRYEGGMERDAISIAENMAEIASQSILITRAGTWLNRKAKEKNILIEPVRMRSHISVSGAIQLRHIWSKHKVGNIIFLGSSEMPTIFLSLLGKRINFIVRHGTTKSRSKQDLIHRLTWSKVRSHWCISEHIRRNVKSIFPVSGKSDFVAYISQSHKFSIIPPVISSYHSGKPLELLIIGRLVRGKGHYDAIKIVDYLQRNGFPARLSIFGDGPERKELESFVEKCGLEDQISLKGEVDAPFRYLHEFDAFIFPSYGEGLGNAFVEALCSGVPCFCYDNTVFPELSELGLVFFASQSGDYASMAENIIEFFRYNKNLNISENREKVMRIFCKKEEVDVVGRYLE